MKVLSISDVAALTGWSYKRTLRHLLAANQQLGGMLLVNVGNGERPRWTVTESALRMLHPGWFVDPDAMSRRIEALEENVSQVRIQVRHQGEMIRMVAERVAGGGGK